ncbi:hypothetical protein [Pandoraea sp. ISTKB]|uniref:hypothetical protein n=1 Tax=Pandoraea sp. ISTKB TaxID=1586708 RepID=UPI001112EC41|nr:hypothetical protein [Pandoraea sp. ISTKB]
MNNLIANNYLRGRDSGRRYPTREQNLFVSLSKHLYAVSDGSLRYQRKVIDPRLPGQKQLLRRYVVLDVDTGVLYGEYHLASDDVDVVGFLARAWHKKPDHPMRGFPRLLNIPKSLDGAATDDVMDLSSRATFEVGYLQGGFSVGIHAVKALESRVQSLIPFHGRQATLWAVQTLSAATSRIASNSMSFAWNEEWDKIPEIPSDFFQYVDKLYTEEGAWRYEPFDVVLNGIPKS